jgi:uncharacterized protein YecE (DUF72 family)
VRTADAEGSLFAFSAADRAMERVAPAPPSPDVRAAAERLGEGVRLGTSSWAYPGWRGIVYAPRAPVAALASHGLAAYAAWPLHRTVGLDRAFYATPSAAEYAALAELVPQAFRFTVKAEQRVTRPDMAPDGGTFGDTVALRHSGVPNPRFLDHAYFRDAVLAPAVEGLGGLLGPVVLQFPHLDLSAGAGLGGAEAFVDRLAAFLARACGSPVRGAAPAIAVEVRNRELLRGALAARYASALRAAGCVHSFLQHPTMPGIAEQRAALEAAGGVPAGPVVVRWMLRSGTTYDAAAADFEPYDRLRAPDEAVRHEVVAMLAECSAARPGFAVINNKAEGSAVRSVEALAAAVAQARRG